MAELTCTHKLRGFGGPHAFEFEFSIGAATRVTFYPRNGGWAPMTSRGEVVTAERLAGRAGLDIAQTAAQIAEAAAQCEREYLRQSRPALHLAA